MQSQRQSADPAGEGGSTVPVGAPASLLSDYRPAEGRYDELRDDEGQPRPVWDRFLPTLARLGGTEFTRRWRQSKRLIYENGIAYSAYGDPEANARPWELDALPLLVHEQEWAEVAAGVAQRADLMRLVLADLYGPQRVLKEGVLPADLLYGNPGFELAYHGQLPPDESLLNFYAADLGRARDGKWWVLADRTEAPSGIGFALENRVVVSRMLPELFRSCRVRRMAPFFMAIQQQLGSIATLGGENPRVVLLSRGPEHDYYFEDAYLARYLGYTLVEGDDLAVRDGRVWLKTLDGLLPIDAVLRRPNSSACDPLEFSGDGSDGVAGLLQTVRTGGVTVSNPLGSGLVESPVFMAFMPRLCKFFLQQDLKLPGIASYWCGEPSSLQHVLANLGTLSVTLAYRRRGEGHGAERRLNQLGVDELRERIQHAPQNYVAQERLTSSCVPVWQNDSVAAASMVIRAFGVTQNDSFTVMSGGLARTTGLDSDDRNPVPQGQGSKDLWIVGDTPVEPVSLLPSRDESLAIRRVGSDLPSRVAENIYWLGRHIERADASARLLRTFALKVTSETSDEGGVRLPALLRALADQGQIEPGYAVEGIKDPLPDIESALPTMIFDAQQPGSLRSVLDELSRVASLVRDRVSVDAWRTLVRIDQKLRQRQFSQSRDMADVLNLVNGLIIDLAAIEGLVMESMTRSHVFRFLDLGRRLERALQTVGLVRSCFVSNTELTAELLEAVLEIADSLMTYRSRYLTNLQLAPVLDMLVTDESNPRSIAYQLVTLQAHVRDLPRRGDQAGYAPHDRLILSMIHQVRMVDIQQLSEAHRLGDQERLDNLLTALERELPMLSHEVSNRYLIHAAPSRTMAPKPSAP